MSKPERGATDKADRALVLHDQGLKPVQIAERLGVSRTNIGGMLQRAKQRREKAKEGVNA